MAEPERKTFRDIMRVVFRRKWLFFLGASLFAFASMCGAHYIPLKYTGETKLSRRSDAAAKMSMQGSESFDTIKLTMEHDLLGLKAVESVITALGLDRGLQHDTKGNLTRAGEEAKQQIAESIKKNAKMTWEVKSADSDLISVSVTHHDRGLAQGIPDELVKGYINRTYEEIAERLTASSEFLTKEVEACKSRLSDLEKERNAFEVEHASMMPESPGAVQKRIDEFSTQIATLGWQKQAAMERVGSARTKLEELKRIFPEAASSAASQPTTQPASLAALSPSSRPASGATSRPASRPTSQSASAPAVGPATRAATETAQVVKEVIKGPNPELKQLEAQLREAEEALVSSRTFGHMTDDHPKVQSLIARIAEIKKKIESTPKEAVLQTVYVTPQSIAGQPSDRLGIFALTDVKGALDAAIREAKIIDDQLVSLQKSRDKAEALMSNFAPIRQQYVEITKKIAAQEAELASWQGRLSGIQMSLAAEVAKRRTHLEAVQAAQEQFLPSWPPLLLVLGFSIGGALAFGIGLVFLANMFDRTISTTDGVAEEFGLPVHGVIGEIVLAKERLKRRLLSWVAVPAVLALAVVCVAGAGLSIVLWLKYREDYARFHATPATYIYQDVVQRAAQWIAGLFH